MWVTAVRVFAKATVSTAEAVHPHDVAVLVFLDLDPGFCNRREGFGKGDFPNKEPRGWFEGWYWNLPVRDSVALELARMLGLEIELKRDRTPKEWARIRSEIQARLKQEFGKPM